VRAPHKFLADPTDNSQQQHLDHQEQDRQYGFAPWRLRHNPALCIKHKLDGKGKVCKNSEFYYPNQGENHTQRRICQNVTASPAEPVDLPTD
jgi:hypothetical protein